MMDTIATYWHEAKTLLYRCLIALGICFLYLFLGAFVFIFIEHCCYVTPVQPTHTEKQFKRLCQHITNIKDESNNYNNYTHQLSVMTEICNEPNNVEIIKCEVTMLTTSKWFKFCSAVIFTLGRYVR